MSARSRWLGIWLLTLAQLACDEADPVSDRGDDGVGDALGFDAGDSGDDAPDGPPPLGLTRIGGSPEPADPHLTELVIIGDAIIVANSNSAIAVYGLRDDGRIPIRTGAADDELLPVRCTTITAHRPSRTLYCGTDPSFDVARVTAIDVTRPIDAEIRQMSAVPGLDLYVADLEVVGEHLFLSRFQDGLWAAEISEGGELGELIDLGIEGNVRGVAQAAEGGLFVLTADRGLLYLAREDDGWVEAATFPIEGPALRLSSDGGVRAIVSMGSVGAVVVDLRDGELREFTSLSPPAVVLAAAVQGDRLALVGAGGLFLYDMGGDTPRLAGFAGEDYLPLDAVFEGDELVVSDWHRVTRHAVDLAGIPLGIQAPRGAYLRTGNSLTTTIRNPGSVDLTVELLGYDRLLDIPAGDSARITVPSNVLAARAGLLWFWRAGERNGGREMTVRFRDEPRRPRAPTPTGGVFPDVITVDSEGEAHPLAVPGERSRIMFFSVDCAAMWPILQDAAWLAARGRLDDGAVLQFVPSDIRGERFREYWMQEDVRFRYPGSARQNPGLMDPDSTDPAPFQEAFRMPIPDLQCTDPTDYLVGEDGVVEAAEREYLGEYHFR